MPVITGKRARRISAHPVTLIVAVAGLVLGPLAVSPPAQAAPEKVLQSVSVQLGDDGSIDGITSTAVHRSGDDARSDEEEFDPTETSDELPVRIQTSYRLGDQSGTDLSEIAGESGRVVIDVTVQNTTVAPQELTYDANGVRRTAYALVGTPLTVVASADLGDGNLGTVVTRDDIHPTQVTNGVVGESGGESGQVQWAAMLAPPRLGSSTSFRLVQETEDFEVPEFAFSIQPGLVTDVSVRRLLEAAFSEDHGSAVTMESRTIELIGEVNAVLAEAGGVLADIQQELGTAASELGARTILDLQASSQHVTSSMQQLSGDLAGLSEEMTGQLDGANDTALAAMQSSVDEVKDLLGDPNGSRPTVAAADGCTAVAPRAKKSATVYQQLVAVSGQLESLAGATDACRDVIEADLLRTVGSADLTDDACRESKAAICVLRSSQSELADHATTLEGFGADFAARFDETLLGGVQAELDDVVGKLRELDTLANGLGGGGTGGIKGTLEDVADRLAALEAHLSTTGEARSRLSELHADVVDLQSALDGELAGSEASKGLSATRQARQIFDWACEVERGLGSGAKADRDRLRSIAWMATGDYCPGERDQDYETLVATLPAQTESLTGRFTDIETLARTSVGSLVELTAEDGPIARALARAHADVTSTESLVADALEEGEPNLKRRVLELVTAVESLTDGVSDLPSGCPPAPEENVETPDAPVQALVRAFETVRCNQEGLTDAEILGVFGAADDTIDDSLKDLSGTEKDLDEARRRADASVGELVDQLGSQLDQSGDRVMSDGREVVTAQRQRLDAEVRQFGGVLDQTLLDAVQAIEKDVDASNGNLEASETRLLADLHKVLIDLGDRRNNGTGLLGSLVTGATRTGVSNQQIVAANENASSFRRVRGQELEDVFLQQAQLARALELQESFPVFGLDLPSGSTHVTVFNFRLGGSR